MCLLRMIIFGVSLKFINEPALRGHIWRTFFHPNLILLKLLSVFIDLDCWFSSVLQISGKKDFLQIVHLSEHLGCIVVIVRGRVHAASASLHHLLPCTALPSLWLSGLELVALGAHGPSHQGTTKPWWFSQAFNWRLVKVQHQGGGSEKGPLGPF